ncbi:MAG TPA: M20/M25/M40 family metallo-hydrolase, partial [Acidobacteriaceae bacterium]|nr:M20/M25/M40 family metallo-hydrolase [Acidobacteriaceae bacterium]
MDYKIHDLLEAARNREKSLLRLLQALVELESPTAENASEKAALDRCLDFAAEAAARLGATVRRHRRRDSGDILEARFFSGPARRGEKPILLLGHLDTVWPFDTLAQMPFKIEKGRAWGPGVLDMKAGVA